MTSPDKHIIIIKIPSIKNILGIIKDLCFTLSKLVNLITNKLGKMKERLLAAVDPTKLKIYSKNKNNKKW